MQLVPLLILPLLLLSSKGSSKSDSKPAAIATIPRSDKPSVHGTRTNVDKQPFPSPYRERTLSSAPKVVSVASPSLTKSYTQAVHKSIGKRLPSLSSTLCKRTNVDCIRGGIGPAIGPGARRRRAKETLSSSEDSDLEREENVIPRIDPTPISKVQARKHRLRQPEIVDTTGDHYHNNWGNPFSLPVKLDPQGRTSSATVQPPGMTNTVQRDKTKTKPPWRQAFNAHRAAQALATPPDLDDRYSSVPRPRLTRQDRYADIRRIPLTENQKRLKDELKKSDWAKKDAAEEKRKKKAQAAFDEGKYGPIRNDIDWIPPRPFENKVSLKRVRKSAYWPSQQSNEHRFLTPYHPNERSSGQILTWPRRPQYSGDDNSPRNDPGFLMYSNAQDPYDRSYVRKDHYVGRDGQLRVAATAVYDAMSHPYHAANKLFGLKRNPALTYTEAAKNAKENRKVTNLVRQTYDENRPSNIPRLVGEHYLANPRDEFPCATNALKDGTRDLTGQERFSKTNVSPVPDSESRAEAKLARATARQSIEIVLHQDPEEVVRQVAKQLARKQNNKNLTKGIPTQRPMKGTGIMDGEFLKYDNGDGQTIQHNLPHEYRLGFGFARTFKNPPSAHTREAVLQALSDED